ncbi:FxLYD domain-containing protein [Dethiothermospora halolimnae]|uniref:FxLYD domain-containing protein n=1 Tax=Dethiothermospora halolimnae TaxID=3114390 RepID=UPI003CCC2684
MKVTKVIILLIISLFLTSCNKTKPLEKNETKIKSNREVESKRKIDGFEVLEDDLVNKDSYSIITGKIKNSTDREYEYLEVNISLFDNEGNKVDTTKDVIENIKIDDIWKFKAVVWDENIEEYNIDSIEGL